MKKHLRKVILFTVKIAVAVVLLCWVFSQVHWNDYVVAKSDGRSYAVVGTSAGRLTVTSGALWWKTSQDRPIGDFKPVGEKTTEVLRKGLAGSLRDMNKPLLAMAFAGFLVSLLIIAVRWWFLLRLQDIHIRLREAVRLTFLGQFFNSIVPGTVGGDLVKAYYVARHTPKKPAVLVSIFMDRVLGLTELALLAGTMLTVVWLGRLSPYESIRKPAFTVGVVIVIVATAIAFLLSRRFRRLLHLQRLYRRLPIAHHIEAMGDAAVLYRRRIGGLLKAVAVTFGAHLTWIASIALIGVSLDLPIPWHDYFLYIPLIYIIGAVPVTPGGVGLIEKLYVVFFAANPSAVLALALLARLMPMIWGLPGVVVAITGPKLPGTDVIQTELGLETEPE